MFHDFRLGRLVAETVTTQKFSAVAMNRGIDVNIVDLAADQASLEGAFAAEQALRRQDEQCKHRKHARRITSGLFRAAKENGQEYTELCMCYIAKVVYLFVAKEKNYDVLKGYLDLLHRVTGMEFGVESDAALVVLRCMSSYLISQQKYREALDLLTIESQMLGEAKEMEEKLLQSVAEGKTKVGMMNELLMRIAMAKYYLGQYDLALIDYENALKWYRKHSGGESREILLIRGSMGDIYYKQGKYEQAANAYLCAFDLCQSLVTDVNPKIHLLSGLGEVYLVWGKYSSALKYGQQALALANTVDHDCGNDRILSNLGKTSCKLGMYDEALDYYNQALRAALVKYCVGSDRVKEIQLEMASAQRDKEQAMIRDRSGPTIT